MRRGIITFFAAVFLLAAFNAHSAGRKVVFITQWTPQAQFAGYYVAKEKGIYDKYGLSVKIINGGPDKSPIEYLKDGWADFASLWLTTGIKERSGGLNIVNIAQIVRKSAFMFVAKKSSGIKEIKDIDKRKVGLWEKSFHIEPWILLKRYNISVDEVPQGTSVNLFLRDGVDVASAMWYNEYHTIINSGHDPEELTTFFFSKHGLNYPEDGIYTLDKTFEDNPALACAFVKASLEGWKEAFAHPKESLDIVIRYMKEAHMSANRVHQNWMLERMKDLMLFDKKGELISDMTIKDYNSVATDLKDVGVIEEIPEFNNFYKDCSDYGKK